MPPGPRRTRFVRRSSIAPASVLILLLAPIACAGSGPGGGLPAVTRLAMNLPADAPIDTTSGLPAVALSPAGDLVVYATVDRDGRRLYARRMDRMEAAALPGTEGGAGPFFSPDGAWVGFFAGGRLRKISLGGLPAAEIAAAPRPGGAVWAGDGTIVAVLSIDAGLVRIPDGGGPPQPVRLPGRPAGSIVLLPDRLPGGRLALVTLAEGPVGSPSVAVVNLDSGETRVVLERAAGARFVPGGPLTGRGAGAATGHLVHVRDGTLIAAPFAVAKAAVTGRPVPIQAGVLADARSGAAHFAVAANGTLIYVPQETAATDRRLVRVDRSGAVRPLVPDHAAFEHPRLFDAGRSMVVSVTEAARFSLWIYDLQDGSHRVLPSEISLTLPLPSPDGRTIAYVAPRAGAWNLFRRPIDGGGDPALLYSSDHPLSPSAWSPDGRRIVFTEVRPDTNGDILAIDVETGGAAGGPQPIVATPHDEWGGVLSPDGRLIAYTSSVSGRREVFVRLAAGPPAEAAAGVAADEASPDPAPAVDAADEGAPGAARVSDGEGYGPIWSPRGGELFFRRGRDLLAVAVRGRPPAAAGPPRLLFGGDWEGESAALANYDLFPDGGSFVMIEGRTQSAGATQINVVLDWFEDLRRQVAIGQE